MLGRADGGEVKAETLRYASCAVLRVVQPDVPRCAVPPTAQFLTSATQCSTASTTRACSAGVSTPLCSSSPSSTLTAAHQNTRARKSNTTNTMQHNATTHAWQRELGWGQKQRAGVQKRVRCVKRVREGPALPCHAGLPDS